jgi:enoyl-CoA hydratase
VVRFSVAGPQSLGGASQYLAADFIEACAEIEAREERPVAVVLVCAGSAFFLTPPSCAVDCDGVGAAWADATAAVARLGPPTIAVLAGDALGPAWELALACDLRIAASHVRVGSPEIRWGRMPAAGGTQRLARLAGIGTALRLLLLGEVMSATQALEIGLLHQVVPADGLEPAAEVVLDRLRTAAPIALAYTKEAAIRGVELPLEDGLRLEADLAALLQTTQDRAEGVASFLQRRAPRYEGR